MGLLQKLKSALGLGGTGSPDAGTTSPGDVDVTVEREPSTASEDAVKGTETGGQEPPVEAESSVEGSESSVDEGGFSSLEDESDADTDSTGADTESAAEDASGGSVPVTEITGIGPAYGGRLNDAGVETVADLAAGDAGELAAETDIAEGRIEGWIDDAATY